MDLGLDEIIKRKKGMAGKRKRSGSQGRSGNKGKGAVGGVRKAAPILDARVKILARQRTNIRDAREKLNALHRQQDARLKLGGGLTSRSQRLRTSGGEARLGPARNLLPRRTIDNQPTSLTTVMDSYHYDRGSGGGGGLSRLGRRRPAELEDIPDLMELDTSTAWNPAALPQLEVRITRPTLSTPFPRQRELKRDDVWYGKPSLIRREESIKSRLEPLRQEEGYRIVVSNLQPTVTHEDIKELFEDIGPLLGSRVVRPGTAEVVYRDLKDAVAAVETYHNRQLDGQPMKCLLVKPPSSVGTKGSVIPDISTIHKALFMK